jgi:hypothetical protein
VIKLFQKKKKGKGLVNDTSVSASLNGDISEASTEIETLERRSSRRGSKLYRSFRKRFSRSKGQGRSPVGRSKGNRGVLPLDTGTKGPLNSMSFNEENTESNKMRDVNLDVPLRERELDSTGTEGTPTLTILPSPSADSTVLKPNNIEGEEQYSNLKPKPKLVVVTEVPKLPTELRIHTQQRTTMNSQAEDGSHPLFSDRKEPRSNSGNESFIKQKVIEPSRPRASYGAPPGIRVGRSSANAPAATTKRGKVSCILVVAHFTITYYVLTLDTFSMLMHTM